MIKVYILGLLKKMNMHGYKLQEELKKGNYESWTNINPNSVYNALRTLERKQFVIQKEHISKGQQSKTVYSITDDGIKEYNELLIDSLSTNKTTFPSDLYVSISFLSDLSTNEVQEALSTRISNLEKQIESWERRKRDETKAEKGIIDEIFKNGLSHLRADLEFLQYLKCNIKDVITEIKYKEKEYMRANND